MSRFVSAGSGESPNEQDEAWLKAQDVIEATRQKKPEIGQHEGGKSLYETLQANKDEDEVEFLDSVLASTREQEAAVKKQTREQLDAFRQQREDAERAAKLAEAAEIGAEPIAWAVGRKRKKPRNEVFGGVKLRKASTTEKSPSAEGHTSPPASDVSQEKLPATQSSADNAASASPDQEAKSVPKEPSPPTKPAELGLGAYSSDEDD